MTGGGAIKWTDEQRRGIETAGRSLLVSAAAGSGKTAVLAARCAHLVCDAAPEHRCDVDELLVVTFTKAAAAEMRNRIERALRERLGDSDDARLARQLVLLDRAAISTLDAFCTAVLRKHFNLADLDPNFRTLDPEESALMRVETARQLLADRYDSDAADRFQQFVDAYADGDDERILWRILHTDALLGSVVEPDRWLGEARGRIAEAVEKPLRQSELGRETARLVGDRLSEFRNRCVDAATQFSESSDFVRYSEHVTELIAIFQELQQAFDGHDFDRLSAAMKSVALPDIPTMASTIPGKDEAKKVVDKLREELKLGGGLFELCRFTAAEWRDGLRYTLPAADEFVELVREFARRYTAAKAEVGALDFHDLERLTLSVLRGPDVDGSLAPSDTARAYHRQFKHVLVDEYQDINEVQDAILRLVSRECVCGQDGAVQNLFCVGDVKQSIYRFRLADPQRFLDRNRRLRTCNDLSIGQVIDLQSNFRSRGPLLDAINCVFERLMTAPAVEIDYDSSHRLRPGATYPKADGKACFAGAPIEMHLLPPPPPTGSGARDDDDDVDESELELELDRTEREAAFVAHRIRELVTGNLSDASTGPVTHVLDNTSDGGPSLRPVRWGDVVILLRATQYKAAQFAETLRASGIPVHSDSGGGFFDSTEIRDLLALLAVLDNLQQDVPVAAVLRSPLSELAEPDDCLARVRLAYPGSKSEHVPFHRAVAHYAAEQDDELAAHLKDFLARVGRWRALAQQRPLAEVLWTIYDATGYLAFCAGLEDGEQRVANLVRLHERARQFGSFQRQGLRRFIQFLESLRQEQDLPQPSVASEADDVVRVMSIHRSKGLEFPIVILPDLGKKHNLQDVAGPILLDRKAGLGLMCVDETKRIRYPSMASVLVGERIRRQTLAEEMRVLYVAMTRAREHVILVGTCKPQAPENWARRWAGHDGALPAEEVLRGACMLDWLGPAAAAGTHLSPRPIETFTHGEDEVRAWSVPMSRRPKLSERQQRLARLDPLDSPPPQHPEAERVKQRLTHSYAHRAFTRLAASQTVGSMTKVGRLAPGGESASREAVIPFEDGLPAPRCVRESLSSSPMEVGATTHVVLQHVDFSRALATRDDVKEQIRGMVARKLVARSEADDVDVDAVVWFASTDLGWMMAKSARHLRRELPVFFPMPQVASPDPLDRVMIRGRIDAMVADADGLVLVDYKTDRVTRDTIDARAEFYRPQVEAYARAIEGIAGQRVKAAHLVFLTLREIRTIAVKRRITNDQNQNETPRP